MSCRTGAGRSTADRNERAGCAALSGPAWHACRSTWPWVRAERPPPVGWMRGQDRRERQSRRGCDGGHRGAAGRRRGGTARSGRDGDPPEYAGDESLTAVPQTSTYLVRPAAAAEVADVLRIAGEAGITVTARGAATGMSGDVCPGRAGSRSRSSGWTASWKRTPSTTWPCAARRHPGPTGPRGRQVRPAPSDAAPRTHRRHRRHHRHQRRRDARRTARGHAPPRARRQSRPGVGRDRAQQRQVRQDVHRLRPGPAPGRFRGHARPASGSSLCEEPGHPRTGSCHWPLTSASRARSSTARPSRPR